MTKKSIFYGVSIAALCTVSMASSALSGEMNILTWEGYADPSVIEPFEAATGCKVSATYVGSNDDPAKTSFGAMPNLTS